MNFSDMSNIFLNFEIFFNFDGMPTVWSVLPHEYRCLHCWRHETFTISQKSSSLSSAQSIEDCFCFFRAWSFTLCKNDLDRNDKSDSVSSSMTNCCALAPRWGQTTGFSALSWFSSSQNDVLVFTRETSLRRVCSSLRANGSPCSIIHQFIRFPLLNRPSLINIPFWVAWWVCVFNGSVALVTRVTANNGSLRSIVLLSTRTQRTLILVSGLPNTKDDAIRHVWNFTQSACLRIGFWCQYSWFISWGPNWFVRTTNQEQLCGFWKHVSCSTFPW